MFPTLQFRQQGGSKAKGTTDPAAFPTSFFLFFPYSFPFLQQIILNIYSRCNKELEKQIGESGKWYLKKAM